MSSQHARIEPSFGRWVLTIPSRKNGSIVDGHTTKRAVLTDGSMIELGHTLFIFFERMPIEADAPALLELTPTDGVAGPHDADARVADRAPAAAPDRVVRDPDADRGRERHRQGGHRARASTASPGRHGRVRARELRRAPREPRRERAVRLQEGRVLGRPDRSPGLVKAADGGTLFLDEIGDLPAQLAGRAACACSRSARSCPSAARAPSPVDLRVVAATHRDLDDMVAEGQFRHDSVRAPRRASASPCRR